MMKKLLIVLFALGGISVAHAQVQTGAGSVWYGPFTPPFNNAGAYEGYNAGAQGESDYFTVGSPNGFYWYELTPGQSSLPAPAMSLSGSILAVSTLKGNAYTASQLLSTPTQCSYPGQMTGIQTTGNANCVSTLHDEYNTFSGCSFANDGANLTCTNTVTLATAMPDTSYVVMCTEYQSPSITTPVLGTITYSISSTTQYTVTETTQGSSAEWPTSNSYGKSYVCHAHHN